MTDKKKKIVCIALAVVLSALCLALPLLALAQGTEEDERFEDYEVLGHDAEGNVILKNDDYEDYINKMLAERAEKIAEGKDPDEELVKKLVPGCKRVGLIAHAETAVGVADDLADKTKFIKLPNWLNFAIDAMSWMLEHPTQSAGAEATFESKISSLGKRKIYYSASDLYELLELQVDVQPDIMESTLILVRTGLGATTTVRYYSQENTNFNLNWGASFYTVSSSVNSYSSTDNQSGTTLTVIKMMAQTVNDLPTYTTSYTSIMPHNSYQVIGSTRYPAEYAENTFITNNSGYTQNHTLISKDTFNICNIVSPISSNTVINVNNVSNYSQYGYYVDNNNNIDFDPAVLLAYIQATLAPQLELQYKNTYIDFPEPGATYGDDDIIYVNPFEDDEEDPTEDTSGQIQPFSIDYNEIISEREMESILAESRYILDTTPYDISLDYGQAVSEPYGVLKQNKELPAEVAGTVSSLYDIALSVIPSEMLSVYGFVAFLAVGMWFILRR